VIPFGGQYSSSGDLENQISEIGDQITDILRQADATIVDLVKLVVFYIPGPGVDEAKIRGLLSEYLKPAQDIAITIVPVRLLTFAESVIEVEGYALPGGMGECLDRRSVTLPDLPPPGDSFCHGVRCGEFVFISGQTALNANCLTDFPDDLPSQNRQVLHNIDKILAALGVDRKDIVKANTWRQLPPSIEQYRNAAKDRFEYFADASPALTGITIPDVANDGVLITIDVWAMRASDNTRMQTQPIQPENHWDWSSPTTYSQGLLCGQYLFVGGQAALDQNGNFLNPDDNIKQTEVTMTYIEKVLQTAHSSFADVIKLKTLYTTSSVSSPYQQSREMQDRHFGEPRPASTHIPVDALAYPGQTIEIEAIAVLKNQRTNQ